MKRYTSTYLYELLEHVPIFERQTFIDAANKINAKEYIVTIYPDGRTKAEAIDYRNKTYTLYDYNAIVWTKDAFWKEETKFINQLKDQGLVDRYFGRVHPDYGSRFQYVITPAEGVSKQEIAELIREKKYEALYENSWRFLLMNGKSFNPSAATMVDLIKF